MITPYQINKAMIDYLNTNWTTTPVREINKEDSPGLPYIECYCKPGEIQAIEIQGAGVRNGVFMINIFTKKGVGVDEGFVYGGLLEAMFWHKTISSIVVCENGFLLPYTEFIGIDDDLQACHFQTIIPFSIITEI